MNKFLKSVTLGCIMAFATNISYADNKAPTYKVGQPAVIDGYGFADGEEVPVKFTMTINNVVKGDQAYEIIKAQNSELPKQDANKEYIVADVTVTYNKGENETLYLSKEESSEPSYALYFSMLDQNGNANAEDMTEELEDSIYNAAIEKGKSASGKVSFVQVKNNNQNLNFIGYGKTVSFTVNAK